MPLALSVEELRSLQQSYKETADAARENAEMFAKRATALQEVIAELTRPPPPPPRVWRPQALSDWTKTQGQSVNLTQFSGYSAVKCAIAKGYYDPTTSGSRSEVVLSADEWMPREGDETELRWLTFYPEDFKAHPKWAVVTQFHQLDYLGGPPPVALELHGETLRFRVMARLYDAKSQWDGGILWKGPLERGRWHSYRLRTLWSREAGRGWCEMELNGELAFGASHQTLDEDGRAYLKMGLYQSREVDVDRAVFHVPLEMKLWRKQ